jgi:alkylated DNA repair dioxygenase AlkB
MAGSVAPIASPIIRGWQASLLGVGTPSPDADFATLERRHLGDGAWADHAPGWLTGADALFDELLRDGPWQGQDVAMYGQLMAQPRLSAHWGDGPHDPGLPPVVGTMADLLSARYDATFDTVGANLYRDGRDSVAWHGDRVLRTVPVATVAIVSLGAPRRFLLRPRGGGRSISHRLGPGDLLVMGGTCQRTCQHCVPKTTQPVGPRISVTFRHRMRPAHGRAVGEITR